ncbi:PREDICTED: RNA-binding protein MEX3B [Aptenodytes forsteri]|uniref:RNA-binding protein MEX3B n=1 Tax=Aptenodytes forsteri TaxID=9233 RepID=UPI0009054D14|nr:PREDICTED: RNA-binding protein MEX3B [Aptenodytes forsteri]
MKAHVGKIINIISPFVFFDATFRVTRERGTSAASLPLSLLPPQRGSWLNRSVRTCKRLSPSNLIPGNNYLVFDFSEGGGGETLDDQRALQIALDQLSLLGLDNDETGSIYDSEPRKKSVNMTECVPVPSSEHVAEIVGRQGCKIKALRAKTNTYIKTPVRGEEPLFVVTGRKEDVAMARREIISAAEHFSMIRASRNKNTALNGTVPGPPNLPGQTTIQVRVPYRVVGLVVGPKGATIKRIQQQTHTYIVTPSRDKEPVFEVTGMPENVDRAREEIEAHIAMRTGGIIELTDENDFHANGTDVGFELNGTGSLWSKPTPPSITLFAFDDACSGTGAKEVTDAF